MADKIAVSLEPDVWEYICAMLSFAGAKRLEPQIRAQVEAEIEKREIDAAVTKCCEIVND